MKKIVIFILLIFNGFASEINKKNGVIWPVLKEDIAIAGEACSVDFTTEGNIVYLHRANGDFKGKQLITEPTVIIIDSKTNKVINRWGKNIFLAPHGLRIDKNNNVFITDIGLNKIFKFDIQGNLLEVYGEDYYLGLETFLKIRNKLRFLPIYMKKNHFAKPTDLEILDDGSFIVTDGYRNSRIAKFDEKGKFLWEINGFGDEPQQFNLPHGIATDSKDNIYVADRSNGRIQVFDKNGKFISIWKNTTMQKPFGIDIFEDLVYVADGGEFLYGDTKNPESKIIVYDLAGNIIKTIFNWGENENELKVPHNVSIHENGNIYVADLLNKRLVLLEGLD